MTGREPALKSIEISESLAHSEKFTGEEKDAEFVSRHCWKALPSSDLLNERRGYLYSTL